MYRLRLRAVQLELLVGALFPIGRNRRQATPVDSALEAQPSFRCLAGEHGLTTNRKATIALSSAIGERLGLFGRPTVSMPPLVLAWHDVERAPLATQGIDECPQAHSPSPPRPPPPPPTASPAIAQPGAFLRRPITDVWGSGAGGSLCFAGPMEAAV